MNTTFKRHPVDMPRNNQNDPALKLWFFQHLKALLGSLYDPSLLGKSPLLEWLNIPPQPDSSAALRKSLIEAIESLKPTDITPRGTKSSRVYEILRQRYIEQQTQRKVADNIGLSPRQLQREEKIAVDILGETIWRRNDLQERARLIYHPAATPQYSSLPRPALDQQELEWLKTTTPAQYSSIKKEIQDTLSTLKGVIKAGKIKILFAPEKENPHEDLCLQAPILRQGLLNILGVCISLVPEGQISIHVIYQPDQVLIRIEADSHLNKTVQLDAPEMESLKLAAELIQLCEGTLLTNPGNLHEDLAGKPSPALVAQISLPITEPITVLVIEDNADALELYRRYLANSRYRFVGASDANEGFSLAQKISPRIIILDVMMPEKDGWSFLGQAKVHPKLQQIPIIISSVLKQASLAQTLGAADFLHKPVNRVDLLSCLDRQIELQEIKSRR
jgi:CheY-like chemotaxis protein